MKLTSLTLKRIEIPFHVSFKHTSAERSETESIWVEARSESGAIGFGEGCPRSYVTGEDLASARAFFLDNRASLIREVTDLDTLVGWMKDRQADLDENPAAWCAIELALLDLVAREESTSVEALLGTFELSGAFGYSAVLGDSGIDAFRATATRYLEMGFTDFKLKLSGRLEHDREKIAWLTDNVTGNVTGNAEAVRIRLDGNNLWTDVSESARFLKALAHPFFGIEEPLGANRYDDLAALGKATGFPMILDESLLRVEQLDELPVEPALWMINLRVSKMGGLLRSLEVMQAAGSLGIPIIIGAQVGETSLLTRAALTLANHHADQVLAQEGAFGSLLLTADVCEPPLMFGAAGILHADAAGLVPNAGFGLRLAEPLSFLRPFDS